MLGAPSIFMKLYLKSLYRDNNPFQMAFFVKDLLEVGGIIWTLNPTYRYL